MTKARVEWQATFYKNIKRQDGQAVDMYILRYDQSGRDITLGIDVPMSLAGIVRYGPTKPIAEWIAKALNEAEKKEPSP